MSKTIQGQVPLQKLIFTHNWEDPACDEKALDIGPGKTVFTVTSGGCNTLGFLRFQPEKIYCTDINPAQTWLMELKQAAFRRLDHPGLISFFGLRPSGNRLATYQRLHQDLSDEAKLFWSGKSSVIKQGIIMNGRYEKFVKIAGTLLRLLQGNSKTKRFFETGTLQAQSHFYEQEWDNKRWRWIFNTLFNKKRLAKKGLNADYFHFDDGSGSFSESFYRRAAHAMKDLPIETNYFLSLYLLGHYRNEQQVPAYLLAEHFEIIRSGIDRVVPVTADSKYWLEQQPDQLFDAFALSNICELMDEKDTHKLFSEVIRTAKPGAKVIFRNLMIPREVPEDLQHIIVKDTELSKQLQYDDRSFVYGKVAAYTVNK